MSKRRENVSDLVSPSEGQRYGRTGMSLTHIRYPSCTISILDANTEPTVDGITQGYLHVVVESCELRYQTVSSIPFDIVEHISEPIRSASLFSHFY